MVIVIAMLATQTLGTWKNGSQTLTAAYFDVDAVRISNSAGEAFVVSESEWLDRLENLQAAGWEVA
jgi:hypothetical protein